VTHREDPGAEYHKKEKQKKRIIQRPIHTNGCDLLPNHRIPFSPPFCGTPTPTLRNHGATGSGLRNCVTFDPAMKVKCRALSGKN
jgi:hypothetical protein